ncbi:MAG: glycogen/starch/alpha-glucan phosphorylase [Candidatus Scalindua rubra]|nr:glycogen/starch/alpha-glucan phosphorylase [Candidatus Scalindua rubra]
MKKHKHSESTEDLLPSETKPPKKSFARQLKSALTRDTCTDVASLKRSFARHLESTLVKDAYSATQLDLYKSLAYTVRDRLVKRWVATKQTYYDQDAKRVYYLSMEYLLGRVLSNNMINLNMFEECHRAMREFGLELEKLCEMECDAGLGNGGLGRLAACFLDSMATGELPAYGYGIRYEYGIFYQKIVNGYQVETPDNWLRDETPWEIARPEYLYPVKFGGRVQQYRDEYNILKTDWLDTGNVMAMAYDMPISGYANNTVNNLRLWSVKSTREFDLDDFNKGNYVKAVDDKQRSETISKILYPNDNVYVGKKLRLKQEFFFVSATLQDIIRRYKKTYRTFDRFPDKVAIQLNDTHPALAIPELMRILIDIECVSWDDAWEITTNTFGYTNHTIMSEAMEKWPVDILEYMLPRHLQIVYEINRRFLKEVARQYPGNNDRLRRVSLIEKEGEDKKLRMAHLAIVGSHSVNGVAALHTELLKTKVLKDFYELFPERFNNKTNGITPRRWLRQCNPGLSALISRNIGDGWLTNLSRLSSLVPFAEQEDFRAAWREIKAENKGKLAGYIEKSNGFRVRTDSIFDCQIKRFHEYKRQLLNVLHIITMYNRIKQNPKATFVPRTVIFAGKAAPGYAMAKLIIKLVNSVATVINNDHDIADRIKVVFLANYSVSQAELIIPATDLSEQISTAGTEASGTGNMKLALNGALTIGTLDGANIEIMNEVGRKNIFIFGLTTREVEAMKDSGYNPMDFYHGCRELRAAIDMIADGFFSPSEPSLFKPIVNSLLYGDNYMLLADFPLFLKCQEQVSLEYLDKEEWSRKSILNVAHMGKFSSDRTIEEYAREIWGTNPVPVLL